MLKITRENYLGEGEQKEVYIHPEKPELCVKFPKRDKKRKAKGLNREIRYTKQYQDELPFLARYVGFTETDRGRGYLFEVVRNDDGSISKTLSSVRSELDQGDLSDKVEEMYRSLLSARAVVSDLHASNILVQKHEGDSYDLMLIDGFGNSDFIKICDYSQHFLKKKLIRKFTQLCKELQISNVAVV